MKPITLYTADSRRKAYNTLYPNKHTIYSVDDLREAVFYDQVFAEYRNNHRSIDDFIVVPFNAKIQGSGDIKNYADYLFDNAGPAILAWMIEGAEKVIKADFRIEQPYCVREATALYHENSDWLEHFISECCEVGDTYRTLSGEFYICYRDFCARTGEYARSTTDFYAAIDLAGYVRKRTTNGRVICGIRLKSDFTSVEDDEDFLS